MWELLQKLEKLGWKPYGKSIAELTETEKNLRSFTSRSSGLWQFVCENGMIKEDILMKSHRRELHTLYETEWYKKYWRVKDYEYRLIESALKDESELEEFLLDNIKIEEYEKELEGMYRMQQETYENFLND